MTVACGLAAGGNDRCERTNDEAHEDRDEEGEQGRETCQEGKGEGEHAGQGDAREGGEGRQADGKKLSQIEAAVAVLAKAGEAMNCKAMVESTTTQGLWTSPGGATPDATLYSSILREITTKGEGARFTKVARGHFALAGRKQENRPMTMQMHVADTIRKVTAAVQTEIEAAGVPPI